jgi:sugar lactone lactonase YvrE
LDAAGNLYIADYNNHRIREVSRGTIKTVAGNGVAGFSGDGGLATSAKLNQPLGVALDTAGNLYIVDQFNQRIRAVSGGTMKTIAGNGAGAFSGDGGPATSASLNNPQGIAVDTAGNLYIADYSNNRIRAVSGGTITTVAGNGVDGFSGDAGPATIASLNGPGGVALDAAGNLYIADYNNNRIREVSGGTITTVVGNGRLGFAGDGGPPANASLNGAGGLVVDAGGQLFIADYFNERVRKVSGGIITTVAGQGGGTLWGDGGPATSAALLNTVDVVVDLAGNLFIADVGNNCVRKVSGGTITTVAGNGIAGFSGDGGPATSASLNSPTGIALDAAGNLYIADQSNHRIRKVSGGTIETVSGNGAAGFSGDGGPATSASLYLPRRVAVDAAGNLYIADKRNNRIRKVSGGTITTVAGNGVAGFSGDTGPATNASLDGPEGVALDAVGNLYIADSNNYRIRQVSGGTITTVAGNGVAGFSGDLGPATNASLYKPTGVAVDAVGNLLIADYPRVRRISGGTINTVVGSGVFGFSGDGGLPYGLHSQT